MKSRVNLEASREFMKKKKMQGDFQKKTLNLSDRNFKFEFAERCV